MNSDINSRRCFLKVLGQAGLVVGTAAAGVRCGSDEGSGGGAAGSSGTSPAIANVKNLPVGSLEAIASESLALGRDAGGVYAFTLICTHQGCDISQGGMVSPAGVVCPCHGSRFDANGNVVQGHASSPLVHFAVTVSATGDIVVDTQTQVAETVRTPVPSTVA